MALTRKPTPPPTRRLVLSERKKELMMAILIQNLDAYHICATQLKPENFGPMDNALRVCWETAIAYFEKHGRLPELELFSSEIEDMLENDVNRLDQTEKDRLNEFLAFAFDPKSFKQPIDSAQYKNFAVEIAKKYMEDSLAKRTSDLAFDKSQVPIDLPTALSNLQAEAQAIATLSSDEVQLAFPTSWEQRAKVSCVSTGMTVFDRYLGGGHVAGEVMGLLGVIGSCKTTTGVQLTVSAAEYFNSLKALPAYDGQPTLSFFVSYEDSIGDLRNRALGCAASIAKSTMDNLQNIETDLSRSTALKPYEHDLFARELRDGKRVKGEYERAQMYLPILNEHMVMLDLRGGERPGQGQGGINEIAGLISQECRRRRAKCGFVCIDYMLLMVRQQMNALNIPTTELRHHLALTPMQAKNRIAIPFKCPVWELQQYSGEANSRNPAAAMHYTDAGECKTWAENLNFCFCVGVPQKPENVAVLACTKHRRQPPRPPTIIKIDGEMSRIVGADSTYRLQERGGKIVTHAEFNEASAVTGGEASNDRTPVANDTAARRARVNVADANDPAQGSPDLSGTMR